MKTKIIYISILLGLLLTDLSGQDIRRIFIGLQPMVTRETFYEEGEFDVNIVPLVVQMNLSNSTEFRVLSIVNMHFGSASNELSQLGAELALPIYPFRKRESAMRGIYAAPVVALAHNKSTTNNEYTLAFEPGYSWILESGFTMNLGLQFGGTYFSEEIEGSSLKNHFGMKFSLGYSFFREKNK